MDKDKLKENLSKINNQIKESATSEVTLVAVSKYSPYEDIKSLYELGHRDFGENRIADLLPKAQKAKDDGLNEIRWHFIGNIQSNDIKKICEVPNLEAIHSISSVKHLRKFANSLNLKTKVFIQFNTSDEVEKSGLHSVEELSEFIEVFNSSDKLHFHGLMTMGKLRGDNLKEDARLCFKKLKSLRDEISGDLKLSMGMSSDFKTALEQGSDYVRVGSAIFK